MSVFVRYEPFGAVIASWDGSTVGLEWSGSSGVEPLGFFDESTTAPPGGQAMAPGG